MNDVSECGHFCRLSLTPETDKEFSSVSTDPDTTLGSESRGSVLESDSRRSSLKEAVGLMLSRSVIRHQHTSYEIASYILLVAVP